MVIKNLMAAEQTKKEGKFLILFSILNFNRSTSARLLLTFSGLELVPPCTNFKFRYKLSGGITPNPCYRIVLFFCGLAINKFKNDNS